MGLVFGLVGTAMAASDSSHPVVITVSAIDEITVNGTPTLTIDSSSAVTDSTCTLDWSTNATALKGAKISAQLGADYTTGITLEAEITSLGGGNGTLLGKKTLSLATSQDLVNGLTCESVTGSVITYTTAATMTVAPDTYTQTVTYTITAL